MPPGRQPKGSPRTRVVARPTPIDPPLQTGRTAANLGRVANERRAFDPNAFLATIAEGRKVLRFANKQRIFAQGDIADAVFYIKTDKVRLTVVSKTEQEATIAS